MAAMSWPVRRWGRRAAATLAAVGLALGAAGGSARADVVTSAPCQLPGAQVTTSPTGTPFITNYSEYSNVSSDTAPADSYVLMGPADYHADAVPSNVIPVAYFKSYEDFYSAVYQVDDSSVSAYGATVVSKIPTTFKWVAYDPEQWGWKGSNPADWTPGSEPTTKTLDTSSPPTYTYSGGSGELGDPTTAMAAFIELAHSFGYHVMVMPSNDLTYYVSTDGDGSGAVNDYLYDNWSPVPNPVVADGEYKSNDPAPWPAQTGTFEQAGATADLYEIQTQGYEGKSYYQHVFPGGDGNYYYEYFTETAAGEVDAAAAADGSSLVVFGGLSTTDANGGSNDAADAAEMNYDFTQSNHFDYGGSPLMSGYWLNMPPSGDVAIATDFLTSDVTTETPACVATFGSTGQWYEGDAAANTLAGSATVTSCSNCADGYRVDDLGTSGDGTLTINDVSEGLNGSAWVEIYYTSPTSRSGVITPNGNSLDAVTATFPATYSSGTAIVGVVSVQLPLNASSSNTIEVSGVGTAAAPSISEIFA